MKKILKILGFIIVITSAIIYFNKEKEVETLMDIKVDSQSPVVVDSETQLDSEVVKDVEETKDLEDFIILIDLVDTFISEHEKSQNEETMAMLVKLKDLQSSYRSLITSLDKKNLTEFNVKIDQANSLREEILDTLDDISIIEHDN